MVSTKAPGTLLLLVGGILSIALATICREEAFGIIGVIAACALVRRSPPFVRAFPFTLYVIFVLYGLSLIWLCETDYDEGGIGGVLFLTAPVWAWPLWLINELLVDGGIAIRYQSEYALGIFAACGVVLDFTWHCVGKFRRKRAADRTNSP
ncbi:MAG: hypothetical protein O2955_13590 [Planctomycetota bacterium]|nr:hypothetical protein [Planctomycetota bacterium]MDA1213542.1 hypothetical protein [Planctomycetota bacterium]